MSNSTIRGWIELDSPRWFDGAVAIVALNDVSKVDVPSLKVAEAKIAPIHGFQQRIPFHLLVEESALTGDSFTVSAEVRRSQETKLQRGDFLTTAALPWHTGANEAVVLKVHEI